MRKLALVVLVVIGFAAAAWFTLIEPRISPDAPDCRVVRTETDGDLTSIYVEGLGCPTR